MGVIIKDGITYSGGSSNSNQQADFTETDITSPAYIKHKPTLGTASAKDSTTTIASDNTDLPTSGAVYDALQNVHIDVDTEIDSTSNNPIANSAVAVALDDKVDVESGKGLSTNDFTTAYKDKLDGIASGAEANVQSDWSESSSTSDAYILNKPTTLSAFTNDQGFITNTVNNLTNYYTKNESYSKTEVDTMISAAKSGRFIYVATLPTTDIHTDAIYLVPKTVSQTDNVKDEYINLDGTSEGWEKIGDTEIDLSNYVQKSQTAGLIKNDGTIDTNTYLTSVPTATSSTLGLVKPDGTSIIIDQDGTIHARSSGGLAVGDVIGATISLLKETATFTWSDPADVTIDGTTLATWAGTKIVRKENTAPVSENDGILIVDSSIRDQYSVNGYTDTTLEYGKTYYYRFFPYTDRDVVTKGTSLTATPVRTIISLPSQSGSLTYDGTTQTATFTDYDSNTSTVTGDSAINAGSYNASFTPKHDYMWSDNTTTAKTVTWSIGQADAYVTLSIDNVTLDEDHLTASVSITGSSGSISSVSSSNPSIVAVNLSGDTITVSSVDELSGTVTITLNISASVDENYKSGTGTFTVDANFLKIVSFADGTDAEIKAMLDAYYADQITWEEMGWAVGDTRLIHLDAMQAPNPNSSNTWAAQDITVVIVAHDHTDLATPINGHDKACITVQTREVLNNNTSSYNASGHIYVNGDSALDTTFTKWSNLYMRTYMNDKVWGAFPTDFKSAIKTSKHNRHTVYNTSESEVVNDNLFLPSYPEVYGTASYSRYAVTSPVEGTQFAYYTIPANRIKYGNNNGSPNSTKQYWWHGSPSNYLSSSYGYSWFSANADNGSTGDFNGSNAIGLAPAFAM